LFQDVNVAASTLIQYATNKTIQHWVSTSLWDGY